MSSTLSFRRSARFIAPAAALLTFLFLVAHVSNRPTDTLPPLEAELPHEHIPPTIPGGHSSKDGFEFQVPVASVQHGVIRGDRVALTGGSADEVNKTEWHSVGRDPNRPECWTYDDRFGPYKSLSAEMAALIAHNNRPGNKRAILLRLGDNQAWGQQFTWHIRSIVMEAGYLAGWDVIIYVHSDMNAEKKAAWLKKVPAELEPLVKTFSTKELKDWIPGGATFKNVYEHNHTPVQMFMAQNTKYDFVYTVEHDVRLIGRWDHFLSDVDTEYSYHRKIQDADQSLSPIPDLVTFQAIQHPPSDWMWLKSEKASVDYFGGRNKIRSSLGVVWGWSRKLTDALTKYNQGGINCYFEYFAPSVAWRENLSTFFYQHPLYCPNRGSPSERYSLPLSDLSKNDPRKVQWNKVAVGCTYYFVPTHSEQFWKTWYKDQKSCRPPALVHPIKDSFFN